MLAHVFRGGIKGFIDTGRYQKVGISALGSLGGLVPVAVLALAQAYELYL